MRTRRLALISLALLCLVAAPAQSPAQDAGVSGIPPGPGNVNGLNGSIRDPSGIGNAARMPSLPQPSIAPVVRFARSRYGHKAERAAVRENDRLLDHKLTTICRGC
jgi:hypothetical protein